MQSINIKSILLHCNTISSHVSIAVNNFVKITENISEYVSQNTYTKYNFNICQKLHRHAVHSQTSMRTYCVKPPMSGVFEVPSTLTSVLCAYKYF